MIELSYNRFIVWVGIIQFVMILQPVYAQPKIEFYEAPTIDLGRQLVGTYLEYDYLFRNVGTDTLSINNVSSSCGNSRITYPHSISAGEEGAVQVTFQPLFGERSIIADFETNAQGTTAFTLSISYQGVNEIYTEPQKIRFWDQVNIAEQSTTILVRAYFDSSPFSILALQSTAPWIRINTPIATPALKAEEHAISLTIAPQIAGRIRETLVITTDCNNSHLIEVPVIGYKETKYRITPDEINTGIGSPGRTLEISALIESRDKEIYDITIIGRDDGSPPFSPVRDISISNHGDAEYKKEVYATAIYPESQGYWRETVFLLAVTSNMEEEMLALPISGTVITR